MTVDQIAGEPLRFHVTSPGSTPYLVDLAELDGNGFCGCTDFQCRRKPIFDIEQMAGPASRCKHIRAARDHVAGLVIARYLEDERAAELMALKKKANARNKS